VSILAKLECDWFRAAFDPDFDFRIEVEVPCCFLGEVIDTFVGHAGVFPLLAGHPLFIHKEKSEVGEHDKVSEQFVGVLNFLSVYEQLGKFILQLRSIDLRGITNQSG
jgi:hypothetical protein